MGQRVPLFKIYWDEEDIASVSETIRQGMNWAAGPAVAEFESRLADYVETKYAVTCNSGTSALHMVIAACDVGPGDEVIVPSFTFIATANAPFFLGARPVFADIEEKTFGLDAEDVERRITPRTKAIMPIHFAGCPCRITELKRVAEKHGLPLIEDAAEALGALICGRKTGSIGDAAILSFCQNKVITTGEGGAVVTNSREIYEKLRLVRSHGRQETHDYFASSEAMDYITLGYNFRMSTITASLGLSQLRKVERLINLRREKAAYLTSKLSAIEEISIPATPDDSFHVYQMYPVRIKGGKTVRDNLRDYLAGKGIASRVYFEPVHLTLFYRRKFGYRGGELPVTERVSDEILSLPMYPGITRDDMDNVAGEVQAFFKKGFHGKYTGR
ncbi:MAG: DegT/DnrJ/EryC1/StrS family aminotransferase [Chloroflexota bacterium]